MTTYQVFNNYHRSGINNDYLPPIDVYVNGSLTTSINLSDSYNLSIDQFPATISGKFNLSNANSGLTQSELKRLSKIQWNFAVYNLTSILSSGSIVQYAFSSANNFYSTSIPSDPSRVHVYIPPCPQKNYIIVYNINDLDGYNDIGYLTPYDDNATQVIDITCPQITFGLNCETECPCSSCPECPTHGYPTPHNCSNSYQYSYIGIWILIILLIVLFFAWRK